MSKPVKKTATDTSLNAAYAAYVRQLDQQEESPQTAKLVAFEYQAKARSRQLDTLLHLSYFSDYLVLISAPPGAGKTKFIEQFMRVQRADACIVHLVLEELTSAPWIVRQLVQQLPIQLPSHASLEISILVIQELAQELTLQKEVLLIVVDNAQWLDEDALELLANLLPRSAKVDSRPHVILSADHSVVERIETSQFAELRQERFYHLVLAPFSQEESADYLRQRLHCIGINHGLAPIQLLQLHQLANGNPGYLNMLANKALNKGGLVQQTGLPLLHIAATIIVVCLLAGVWLMNNWSANPAEQAVMEPELAVQAVEVEPMAQALPPLEPLELSPPSKNITLDPTPTLPLKPLPVVITVPEKVTKALPEVKVELALEPKVKLSKVTPALPLATPAKEPLLDAALANWPKLTALTKQPYSYTAMLKLPSDHYSLQVLGARLETTIEAFIGSRNIMQPHYIIQLERGGEPWHILLVGDYASSSDARDAISSLPMALHNLQPWARPVVKIQQQIRNKFNTSGE